MPQRWTPIVGFTVRETLEYAAWLKGASRTEQRVAAQRAAERIGLTELTHRRVERLSGGQQRRVGLAEAMVMAPRTLILDEPTVGLDPEARHEFRELLRDEDTGRATLLSTHLTDDTAVLADNVIILKGGSVLFRGQTDDLRVLSGDPRAEFLDSGTALESGYLAVVRSK